MLIHQEWAKSQSEDLGLCTGHFPWPSVIWTDYTLTLMSNFNEDRYIIDVTADALCPWAIYSARDRCKSSLSGFTLKKMQNPEVCPQRQTMWFGAPNKFDLIWFGYGKKDNDVSLGTEKNTSQRVRSGQIIPTDYMLLEMKSHFNHYSCELSPRTGLWYVQ